MGWAFIVSTEASQAVEFFSSADFFMLQALQALRETGLLT
jgi:hypothetical protein